MTMNGVMQTQGSGNDTKILRPNSMKGAEKKVLSLMLAGPSNVKLTQNLQCRYRPTNANSPTYTNP
jgi:hypothetical protein